jgi:tRNA G18 (ribose-2'-O)-methylase SpoU
LSDYVGLTDPELRRLAEQGGGFFIAEGERVVRRLLRSSHSVRSVLLTPARMERLRDELRGTSVPVYVAEPDVLNAIVGFNLHRGAVASADRLPDPGLSSVLAGATTVAVLEGINDHENLGAVFRSAAALGIDGIILDPTTADPYYRRSVRVSMGAVLVVPFTRAERWSWSLDRIRARGFRLVALTPDPNAAPIGAVDGGSGRDALLLGAEGPGLSPATLALSDLRVRIPVEPAMDSLNVGHAAAIAFYRFGRVRTAH